MEVVPAELLAFEATGSSLLLDCVNRNISQLELTCKFKLLRQLHSLCRGSTA